MEGNGTTNGTTTPPNLQALREQRRALRLQLEIKQLERTQRLTESLWWESFDGLWPRGEAFGTDGWLPVGGYGLPNALSDRKHGDSWPLFRTEQEHGFLRGQGRLVCATNSYAIGLLSGLTSYVIGTGYTYRVTSKDDADDKLVAAAQDVIDDFCDLNEWGEWESEIFWRTREDGEAFVAHFAEDGRTQVRSIEPEQIRNPPDVTQGDGWTYGLKHKTYYEGPRLVQDVQTIEEFHAADLDQVNAEGDYYKPDILTHYKINTKRSIKRGLTDFCFSTADAFENASRLRRAIGEGAAVQASTAEIWQHQSATQAQVSALTGAQTDFSRDRPYPNGARRTDYQKLEPGTIRHIPSGMQLATLPGAAGSAAWAGYTEALQAVLRAAGVRWNAPEWLASGLHDTSSFASSLTAESPFVISVKRLQAFYKRRFRTTMEIVLRNAAAVGRLPRDILKKVEVQVEAPPIETRDPLKEAQVDSVYVQMGAKSVQTVTQELGLDYEQEQVNREEYQERTGGGQGNPLAMPPDEPPGQGPQGNGQPPGPKLPGGRNPLQPPGPPASRPPVAESLRETKDASGHEHDPKGLFTGSGGKAGGKEGQPAPKKRLFQQGEDVAKKHHQNMKALLGKMQKGEYDPADALKDVEYYHDLAAGAAHANYRNRFNVLRDRFARQFGDDAVKSPEFGAVKDAFRNGRDKALSHIDDMSDVVRSNAEYHARPENAGKPVKVGGLDELAVSHDALVQSHYDATNAIGDAADAFRAKHKQLRESVALSAMLAEAGVCLLESSEPILLPDYPHYRQSYPWDCGVASMLTVLKFFGVEDTEPEAIAELQATAEGGTRPEHLVTCGVRHDLECLARSRMTLDELRRQLEKGRPVILPLNMWGGGHYVVAVGIDSDNLVIMDPAADMPGTPPAEGPAVGEEPPPDVEPGEPLPEESWARTPEGHTVVPLAEFTTRWQDTDADGNAAERLGLSFFRPGAVTEGYDPGEKRDDSGQWTGGGKPGKAAASHARSLKSAAAETAGDNRVWGREWHTAERPDEPDFHDPRRLDVEKQVEDAYRALGHPPATTFMRAAQGRGPDHPEAADYPGLTNFHVNGRQTVSVYTDKGTGAVVLNRGAGRVSVSPDDPPDVVRAKVAKAVGVKAKPAVESKDASGHEHDPKGLFTGSGGSGGGHSIEVGKFNNKPVYRVGGKSFGKRADAEKHLKSLGGTKAAPSAPSAARTADDLNDVLSRGRRGDFSGFDRLEKQWSSTPVPHEDKAAAAALDAASQARTSADAPELPKVIQAMQAAVPGLTTDQAHAALFRLHKAGKVQLQPFTRAVGQVPEPSAAMPVGGEVMYYVGRPVRESKDSSGHEHKGEGEGGGQFTAGGNGSSAPKADAPKAGPLSAVKATAEHAKAAAARVGQAVWDRLPPKVQAGLTRTYAAAKYVEHKVMTGFAKSKEMAVQVAKERGLDPAYADKVGRILGTIDVGMAWTVNMPAVAAATGSLTAAKAASWVPVASLSYVAYSTARNPYASIRAARTVLGKKKVSESLREALEDMDPDAVARLYAALADHAGDDWFEALLAAALDDNAGDVAKAVDAAEAAYRETPAEPEGGEPWVLDDGETVE